MALEDFVEPEVGIAIAATAALSSPKVREVARRGLVYGLAGAMMAGDYAMSFAQGVSRGVRQTTAALSDEPEPADTAIDGETVAERPAPKRRRARRARAA